MKTRLLISSEEIKKNLFKFYCSVRRSCTDRFTKGDTQKCAKNFIAFHFYHLKHGLKPAQFGVNDIRT